MASRISKKYRYKLEINYSSTLDFKSIITFRQAKKISFFTLLSLSIFIMIHSDKNSFATHNTNHILGFAAAGDWGCNSNTDATATAIFNKGNAIDIVLGLGDYSYQSKATCFISEMKESDNNIFPKMSGSTLTGGTGSLVFGNHDDASDNDRTGYSSAFNFPNSGYYSFNVGTNPNKVHFLFMSTEDSFSVGSSQHKFVTDDLATAAGDSNIKWIIVAIHKPLYASKNSGNDATHEGYTSFRAIYHPIFDQRGVDLVLAGHTHDYQRTFPITYGGSSSANPVIQSTDPKNYNDPSGIIHVIAGAGGVNFYKLEDKSQFVSYQQDSRFGHLHVDITKNGDSQTLTGNFYGNGVTEPMDTFTINKGSSPSPSPSGTYVYTPSFVLKGNTKIDIPSSQSLQASSSFTIASWFKTSAKFSIDSYFVSKGAYSTSELSGENQNYGLMMDADEKVKFSFESTTGSDVSVVSPLPYNDGKWHYTVGVFDDPVDSLKLYIDGKEVASISTTLTPDSTGIHPFTIGANSNRNYNYFVGELDEVRLWNGKALTSSQISEAFTNGIFPSGDTIQLAFNPVIPNNYKYNPFESFSGSNYIQTASSSTLQAPSSFTLESWFKTSTDFTRDGFLVGKGGLGSETAGKNQNYGIWINSAEKIMGGFETSTGYDNYLISPLSYNDNVWHQVILVFDDPANKLTMYVDGSQVATKSTSSVPDATGIQPLRIGANSQYLSHFFSGSLDEVRFWNGVALSAQQVSDAFNRGIHALGTEIASQYSFDIPGGLSVAEFKEEIVEPDLEKSAVEVKEQIVEPDLAKIETQMETNQTQILKTDNENTTTEKIQSSTTDTKETDIPLIIPFQ